ncbi:LCP family protein [Vulcanimicrobium alpinum]|nr:LCP family protein [Vulcanimicrobium alpinum]
MNRTIVAGMLAGGALAATIAVATLRAPVQHAIAVNSAESAFHSHRLNLLLLGYQGDEGNSDTVILVHLDIDRRTATLVSIPRDTWVPIPGHGYQKINAAIGFGGPAGSAKAVTALTGVPIDATIAVQPEGAKQLVDAMGGMNVDVEHDMDYDDNYGNLHIHLKRGEQYLTGGQVLGYMRFRHDAESDWGRVRRQQIVLKSLIDQMGLPQNWAKLPRLLALARTDMQTTLTDPQLAALLEIYRGVPADNIRTFTMPGRAAFVGDASVVLVDQRWARIIGRLLFTKSVPPQDEVLVANATGIPNWNATVVGALRGGGWNVATFVDQPVRAVTTVSGSTPAAAALAKVFGATRKPTKTTTLVLGMDVAPQED